MRRREQVGPRAGPAGERDAFEAEMTAAGVAHWRLEVLGGIGHSFTNVDVDVLGMPGVAYDEATDRRTWTSALALLDEVL
jgi:dienelactone hydrolase